MKQRIPALAACAAAVLLLAACGSSVNLNDVPVETRTPAAGATPSTGPAPTAPTPPQSQVTTVQAGAAQSSAASALAAAQAAGRVVYFDYDSFVVRDDGKPVIDLHAKALVADRSRKIVIEGHTDERGGREYNLALGQKRAQAVVQAMKLLGVADNQLEAVSYGEERPAAQGADEAAFAKNRRAELKEAR
ncbi:MAG: peptidoglycan-associated lipoprotein Pal [Rubrivivax sp.]|nr:peptidoglycan-associated lipoprotein Pal [Rubrivivax sp.]